MKQRITALIMLVSLLVTSISGNTVVVHGEQKNSLVGETSTRNSDVAINASNFPDVIFRKIVAEYDEDQNNKLSASEIEQVISMDVSKKDISSLEGIKYFTSLEELYCDNNKLISLDVSALKNLEILYCGNNELTNLNVVGLANLKKLLCGHNYLKKIDLTGVAALSWFDCLGNEIASLDVSGLKYLNIFYCASNQLTSLNVAGLTRLEILYCGSNQLSKLDLTGVTKLSTLNVSNNEIESIDISRNLKLNVLNTSYNKLISLDVSMLNGAIDFECNKNEREVYVRTDRTIDLTLPSDFGSKVSEISGAVYEQDTNTLIANEDVEVITYTYDVGNNKTAEFSLCITDKRKIEITPSSLHFYVSDEELEAGVANGKTLNAKTKGFTSEKITWTSKDKSIATVDETGRVTPTGYGRVEIMASTVDEETGDVISATTVVKVFKEIKNLIVDPIDVQFYTGEELTPEINVYANGELLEETGYTLKYENNTNVGTATFIVTGVWPYNFTITQNFTIGYDFSKAVVVPDKPKEGDILEFEDYVYNGKHVKPGFKVMYEGAELEYNKDYTAEYENYIMAKDYIKGKEDYKTPSITITGAKDYYGTQKKYYSIKPRPYTEAELPITYVEEFEYTGSPIVPTVTITFAGSTLSKNQFNLTIPDEANNVDVGTVPMEIRFTWNHSGTVQKEFRIVPCELAEKKILIENKGNPTYTGQEVYPELEVSYEREGAKVILEQGKDYEIVSGRNSVEAGRADAEIVLKGNYSGSKTFSYDIDIKEVTEADITIEDQTYTGKKIIPQATIYENGILLTEGTDYHVEAVEGENNTVVGVGYANIVFKGNYSGNKEVTYQIVPKEIAQENLVVSQIADQIYTGDIILPEVTVTDSETNTVLVPGADYQVTAKSSSNNEVGTAYMTIELQGNYSGSKIVSFTIIQKELDAEEIEITGLDQKIYTGHMIVPNPTVVHKEKKLILGRDYTILPIDGRNNTDVGMAYFEVRFIGNYDGSREIQFEIVPRAVEEAMLQLSLVRDAYEYTAKEQLPEVTVVYGGVTMTKDVDYVVETIDSQEYVNVGTVSCRVRFIKNYTGSRTVSYQIVQKQLTESKVAFEEIETVTYTKEENLPRLTLKDIDNDCIMTEGVDYHVTAIEGKNSIVAGDAYANVVFEGNYAGEAAFTYTIERLDIAHENITVSQIEDKQYTGEKILPEVQVYDEDKELVKEIDYTVSTMDQENCTEAGEAKLQLTGKGNYAGTKVITFTIVPKLMGTDEVQLKTEEVGTYTYNGDKILPEIPVYLNDRLLEQGIDYVVESIDGKNCVNAGNAFARVRLLGNFNGSFEFEYEIEKLQVTEEEILVSGIVDQPFIGRPILPGVKVVVAGRTVSKTDYRVESIEGKNNTENGTAYVAVILQNNYSGSKEVTFTIKPSVALEESDLTVELEENQYYTGKEIYPEILLKYGENELVCNEDYKLIPITGENNTNLGQAKVRIQLLNKYQGTKDVAFNIIERPLSKEEVTMGEIPDVTYNGKVQFPSLDMSYNDFSLVLGEDYTISEIEDKNAANVGEAFVKITFMGNFTGSFEVPYTIVKRELTEENLVIDTIAPQTYTGESILPSITVTDANDSSIQYVQGKDFDVVEAEDENCKDAGEATVAYKFKGNYYGEGTVSFTILPKTVASSEIVIEQVDDAVYSGEEVFPHVAVKAGQTTLVLGKDYLVSAVNMTNCVNAGRALMLVTLVGNYSGAKEFEYQILAKELQESEVTIEDVTSPIYTSDIVLPEMTVKYDERILRYGVDYTLETAEGSDNVNAGAAEVVVQLQNNYAGSKMVTYQIQKKQLDSKNVIAEPITNQVFTGEALTPDTPIYDGTICLVEGKDYVMESADGKNNRNVGEAFVKATFMGNYDGRVELSFTIDKKVLAEQEIKIEDIQPETYTGEVILPEIVVTDGEAVLEENVDYTVSVAQGYENIQAGTAVMQVTLCGNYSGSRLVQFTISPRELNDKETDIAAIEDKTYTGAWILPDSTVSFGTVTLVNGVDYEVQAIEDRNCVDKGIAIVRYQFKGNYSGSKDVSFRILAQEVTMSQLAVTKNEAEVYTGGSIFPQMSVVYKNKELVSGIDYQVVAIQGKNNTNVGAANVKIEFIGNYYGEKQVAFTITARELTEEMLTVKEDSKIVYNGTAILPGIELSYLATTLKNGLDYTISAISSENNTNVGEAKVLVKLKGNYSGSFEYDFVIHAKELQSNEISIKEIEDQVYTGEGILPVLVVKDGGTTLVLDKDYVVETIDGVNNKQIGHAKLRVNLQGNYAGTKDISFNIVKKQVVGSEIIITEFDDETVSSVITIPEVIVWDGQELLKEGEDYSVEIIKMPNGMNSVKINLKGEHANSPNIMYNIVTKTIESKVLSVTKIENQPYTGDVIIPNVKIRYGSLSLVEGYDYQLTTVEGVNCKEVGTAKVKVEFMNNFSGTAELSYVIVPVEMENEEITFSEISTPEFTGTAVFPEVTVLYKGTKLQNDVDYTIEPIKGENQSEVGEAKAMLVFKGNYKGQSVVDYTIKQRPLDESEIMIAEISDEIQGDNIRLPDITLVFQGKKLEKDVDFVFELIDGEDYTNVGTPCIRIRFIGSFTGVLELHYRIIGESIFSEDITVEAEDVVFSNQQVLPSVALSIRKQIDESLLDYAIEIVENQDAVNVGEVKARLVLKGYYSGTKEFTYKILPKELTESAIVVEYSKTLYHTGKEVIPEDFEVSYGDWKLEQGKDFTVERVEEMDYSTLGEKKVILKFIGNYEGTRAIEVGYEVTEAPVITPPPTEKPKPPAVVTKPITKAPIAIQCGTTAAYNGKAVRPTIKVTDGKNVLKEGTHYRVTFSNNVNPGTAKVVIRGIGQYTGSVTKTFKVTVPKVTALTANPAEKAIALTWAKQPGVTGYEVYIYNKATKKYVLEKRISGRNKNTYTDKKLAKVTGYKYKVRSYKKINGKRIYGSFSKVLKTSTAPATPALTVAAGKKTATAKWKKVKGASGYEVYIATSKNGKYTLASDVKKAKTVKYTKKSLKSKKTYYMKMRAYKTVSGEKVYSAYSKTVSVKVK